MRLRNKFALGACTGAVVLGSSAMPAGAAEFLDEQHQVVSYTSRSTGTVYECKLDATALLFSNEEETGEVWTAMGFATTLQSTTGDLYECVGSFSIELRYTDKHGDLRTVRGNTRNTDFADLEAADVARGTTELSGVVTFTDCGDPDACTFAFSAKAK